MQQDHTSPNPGYRAGALTRFQRTNVPASALPAMRGRLRHRGDVPGTALPTTGPLATTTEWLGRLAAILAIALFILVLICIHKGKLVRDSAYTVVSNFTVTNAMFDERADLTAPATARRQLDELASILADLNTTTTADVDSLAGLLPNARTLLAAGQGDATIAAALEGVATTLQSSAASLARISTDADQTVTDVDSSLVTAIDLVNQLNAELTRTTNKLALIPAQDAFIPAPGENK